MNATSTHSNPFQIVVREVAAPGRGSKYYYPAEVRVLDTRVSEWHAVRGLNDGIKFRRRVCGTRHSGPRSEYGQALAAARHVAEQLNAAHMTAALTDCCL